MIKLKEMLSGYEPVDDSKSNFDRPAHYEEYYKNLTPSEFSVMRKGNYIVIKIT